MTASLTPPRMPLWTKAAYGFADTGINVFVIFKGLLILAFMVQYAGIDPALAGWVTSSVLVLDIITDPIMGWVSDRTGGRFGRRHPYIFSGAVLMVALMVLTFAVPAGLGPQAAALWILLFFGLSSIAFTMVAIPYSSLAVEITDSPRERSTMTGWRMAAAGLGILLTGGAFPILINPSGLGLSHPVAILVYAPIIIGTIWLACLATYRFRNKRPTTPVSLGRQIGAALRNRRFVVLVAVYGVQTIGIAVITAGIPFAAAELIITEGSSGALATVYVLGAFSTAFALFVLGSMLSQALWVALSVAIGKITTFAAGTLYYAAVLTGFFLVLPTTGMIEAGQTNLAWITLFIFLIGSANGCYQQLPWAIMPDLVDWSAKRESFEVAGAFSGFWLLGQKVGNAIAPLFFTQILAAYGWIATQDGGASVDQPDAAVAALRWSLTLVPAGLFAVSVPLYLWLDRQAKAAQEAA